MKNVPDLVRSARRVGVLRKIGWPLYREYMARTASGVAPPIVINSIPKAGTHLVMSLLSRVPGIKFSGEFIVLDFVSERLPIIQGETPDYDKARLSKAIGNIRAGTFGSCHLHYDEYIRGLLTSPEVSALFIIRDPRDIVVSQLTYVEQFRQHPRHDYLMSTYRTRSERLDALITGWEPCGRVRGMADLGTRLRAYTGWSHAIPTFKYEEFISPSSLEGLEQSLYRLLQAAGLSELIDVETMKAGIGDKWSATLNKAAVGGWKDAMSERQAATVAEVAGDYFTEYGYELT